MRRRHTTGVDLLRALDDDELRKQIRRNRSEPPDVLPTMMSRVENPQRLRHSEFEPFYRAQWQEVYRPLAVVLRDPDLAREATDEAMTRALRHWKAVAVANNQVGWVYRVAHNWALDQIRRRQRWRRLRPSRAGLAAARARSGGVPGGERLAV